MLASHERYFRVGGRTLYAFMLPLTEYQGMGSNKSHHTNSEIRMHCRVYVCTIIKLLTETFYGIRRNSVPLLSSPPLRSRHGAQG